MSCAHYRSNLIKVQGLRPHLSGASRLALLPAPLRSLERAQQNLAGWPLMVGYSNRIAAEHRPNLRRSMAHPELEETLPECLSPTAPTYVHPLLRQQTTRRRTGIFGAFSSVFSSLRRKLAHNDPRNGSDREAS